VAPSIFASDLELLASMRGIIADIERTISGSRDTMRDARLAIEAADRQLARWPGAPDQMA
jgi:hypothetical protein